MPDPYAADPHAGSGSQSGPPGGSEGWSSAPQQGMQRWQGAPVAPQQTYGLAMKRRNPVGIWLGLPLITFGIYHLVWYYKIHREMAEFDRRREVPIAGPMLVLLFLSWTLVAPLVSYFNTGKRIAAAQRAAGLPVSCSAGIGLLLCFLLGLHTLYYQAELNKVVDSYGAPKAPRWPYAASSPRPLRPRSDRRWCGVEPVSGLCPRLAQL